MCLVLWRTRGGTTKRGTVTSGVTGLAHFSLQCHLLFSQGESVDQVEEGRRHHQGDIALLVHAMLIHEHHTEGIEWDAQQQPRADREKTVKPDSQAFCWTSQSPVGTLWAEEGLLLQTYSSKDPCYS